VAPLDAEDIAMARLQAHLRRTEAMHTPPGPAPSALTRTTVQMRRDLLKRVRDRARREGVTISEVVGIALERYLRSS
jgi:hypothetical protein